MTYNEVNTRANLINPRLDAAGWGRDQIAREHCYRRDLEYTPGYVILRGTSSRRKERCIVAHLDALQAKLAVVQAHQAATQVRLDALLPSILDKAFSGEL